MMDSSEIDRMVTSYVLNSGLFAENLSIAMPTEPVKEVPYSYSSLANSSSNRTSSTDSSTTSDSSSSTNVDSLMTPYTNAMDSANTTEASGVQCVGLRLVVTGSQSTCQAFIDDICTKPAVRITGFEWGNTTLIEKVDEETGIVTLVDSGKVRLTITLNLYMADFEDYEVTTVSE